MTDDHLKEYMKRVCELEKLCADHDALFDDIAASGVELNDERMSYVIVQIERGVWEKLQKGRDTMGKLKPPTGYPSWIEYAIATMDTRTPHLESCDDSSQWRGIVQGEEMREAAKNELKELRERIGESDEPANPS
jgi:hypothetical protein